MFIIVHMDTHLVLLVGFPSIALYSSRNIFSCPYSCLWRRVRSSAHARASGRSGDSRWLIHSISWRARGNSLRSRSCRTWTHSWERSRQALHHSRRRVYLRRERSTGGPWTRQITRLPHCNPPRCWSSTLFAPAQRLLWRKLWSLLSGRRLVEPP